MSGAALHQPMAGAPARSVKCPFCLESIPAAAAVCRHCTRDVALVITMQARVRQLEGAAPAAAPEPPTVPAAAGEAGWRLRLPITALYLVTVVMVAVPGLLAASPIGEQWLFPALGAVAGAATALVSRRVNLSVVFFLGAIQPFVFLAITALGDLALIRDHAASFLPDAVAVGAATAVGALLGSLPTKQWRRADYWGPKPLFDLLELSEGALARVERWLLKLAAVGVAAAALFGIARGGS